MSTETLSTYHTRTGAVAIELRRHTAGRAVSYSFTGKLGAGSGSDFEDIKARAARTLTGRRGLVLVSGLDLLAPTRACAQEVPHA